MRRTTLIPLLLLSGAALAAAPARAAAPAPQLTADPVAARPGSTVTLAGRGFPRETHVALFAGTPGAPRMRIGGALTGRRGRFVATIHIRARADAGALVAVACADACRVQASARFRIAAR